MFHYWIEGSLKYLASTKARCSKEPTFQFTAAVLPATLSIYVYTSNDYDYSHSLKANYYSQQSFLSYQLYKREWGRRMESINVLQIIQISKASVHFIAAIISGTNFCCC